MQSNADSIDVAELREECRRFCRYLLGREPDAYVLERYVDLQRAAVGPAGAPTPLDSLLLGTARSGAIGLKIADAFARIFRPRGLLRRKLILVFAILENSRGFHPRFTAGASSSLPLALASLAATLVGFGLAFAASLVVIGPRAVLAGWRSRRRAA